MQAAIARTVQSRAFQLFIIGIIVFAGILVGIETFPEVAAKYEGILHIFDRIIIWIFIGELILKIIAEGRQPWKYFQDPWNVFDFAIIVSFFLPINTHYAVVLRMVRLLRVLKLVKALPRLQILVNALLNSLPSMLYVSLLLCLLFYIYGVAGTFMFAENDPVHFASLPLSLLSLFRVVTLEDWTDVMYIQMYGCDRYGYSGMEALCTNPSASPFLGAFFFVSFVLIGSMVVINLFIGVMTNSIEESSQEQKDIEQHDLLEAQPESSLETQFIVLQEQLQQIQASLEHMKQEVTQPNPPEERDLGI